MALSEPLLKMEKIGKAYFGNRVLKDVSFTLEKGQILGLVGENGAGKSTLMNILFGMSVIQETGGYEGKFFINGEEAQFKNPLDALDAGIGMVHQEFSLIPGFTAAENIVLNREPTQYNVLVESFGDRLRTLNTDEMELRGKTAIEKLNVVIDSDTLVSEMPVGHKQFTEIAREIDKEKTQLLVLDEPTAVLTESEAEILLASMRKLAAMGIAIIFISHRLHEIIDVCDKIVVLRDGQVVHETTPAQTNVMEIATHMVGRNIESAFAREETVRSFAKDILKVEHLWVDMPGETVRDVSFSVKEGEIFGIGGLAGQGKLGIANGIMGMYPSGGSVVFDGKEVVLNDPRSPLSMGIASVSEDRRGVGLLLEEPISWNIIFTTLQMQSRFLKPVFGGLFKIRDEEAIREATQKYIEALEIKCTGEHQRVQELSGGNQQKVCLAKAFALHPKLLFVSEPTRGIDVGAKRVVLDTLREYNQKRGTTIVMISSELEELRSICDQIAIVNEGRIGGTRPATCPSTEFGLLMLGEIKNGVEKVGV
ncbi:MAG: sugar ABC transporter ATP-binding protein [Aminobacterium sp.]|jgi:simple sugar transport system ATP-binding protein|uniref:sugar ABC transporter ATP-binding protein n=1 Tax=unclassified Aminobacterium TaxID=2685012 RepID=UPI001BD08F7F|nr:MULTISPECIES: sugar ABC transporter ATP-binding protein [unclassified Aminobacterium]MDD2206435.1 sugar ABC transporter ATP-binding protein [Aminobacterium sp.]MDD3425331.1 sugar ABC transporter ATP-binding protein [Aminobacterium sp.]MDD4228230.1 sugar ABC transporter ATP-binding protein [Aminobacterium sp.]MDD4551267.1 sugar ABC transporter ATP-binding protein [Aminobacterium sp.]MEA4877254.1 sugar ABC transporter ATP-binding protein [Aminobacterium sp.]